MGKQEYRCHPLRGLRRRFEPFNQFDGHELKSEDFDSDEEFALAVASQILTAIHEEREQMEGTEDGSD